MSTRSNLEYSYTVTISTLYFPWSDEQVPQSSCKLLKCEDGSSRGVLQQLASSSSFMRLPSITLSPRTSCSFARILLLSLVLTLSHDCPAFSCRQGSGPLCARGRVFAYSSAISCGFRVVTGTDIVHDHQSSRNFKCGRSILPNRLKQ